MDKMQFKFRAFVERTNTWLKSYRKLRYRYERKRGMFQAVVDLACLLICLRRVETRRSAINIQDLKWVRWVVEGRFNL